MKILLKTIIIMISLNLIFMLLAAYINLSFEPLNNILVKDANNQAERAFYVLFNIGIGSAIAITIYDHKTYL